MDHFCVLSYVSVPDQHTYCIYFYLETPVMDAWIVDSRTSQLSNLESAAFVLRDGFSTLEITLFVTRLLLFHRILSNLD
jgi:hypothetical protein